MREGSLEAPTRHPIEWNDPAFTDLDQIDQELRRVFDICHGCRRCFNLCGSFPKLFDLIDESETGELDTVASKDFKPVVDACTLCDMCFMTKCPYVPPHEFNLDFPHLMLRYRAAERARGKGAGFAARQLTQIDRNGKLAGIAPGLANWASDTSNGLTRPVMEKAAGIHREAALPKFHGKTFVRAARSEPAEVNGSAPAYGRKAVLSWIDKGYDVIALVPSCALMLKFEWPLILPDDKTVERLSQATFDISEYIVGIAKNEGLAEGLGPLPGGVALHLACHARAQNMGQKAAEMMRLLPAAKVAVIERCSGHGGSWGIMKENFETALKVGRPVARQAAEAAAAGKTFVASECPLAVAHIVQGMDWLGRDDLPEIEQAAHPIELFARAYGITLF